MVSVSTGNQNFESLHQLFCLQNNCSPSGLFCSGECIGFSRSLLCCSCIILVKECGLKWFII